MEKLIRDQLSVYVDEPTLQTGSHLTLDVDVCTTS